MDTLLHTPDGVRDVYGQECAERRKIQEDVMHQFRLFGYECIDTPSFEFFDVFNQPGGTVSSREMYKFFDRDNRTLVLRPDMTPAVARAAAKFFGDEDHAVRLCYAGSIFQNHYNYKGSMSEMVQTGVELIGDDSADADVEILLLTIQSLLASGLKEFQVEVGDVGFYRGLVEEAGLTPEEDLCLRTLIENKNSFGVEEFVDANITDPDLRRGFLKLPELFGGIETVQEAAELTKSREAQNAIRRLEKISRLIRIYGLSDYVSFDLGMLSMHDYYTGMIFRAYSYGTGDYIVQGGRYDRLLKQFGKDAPAVGFGITLNRLMAALRGQKIEIPTEPLAALVVYDGPGTEKAVELIRKLRSEGKRVASERFRSGETEQGYRAYAGRIGAEKLFMLAGSPDQRSGAETEGGEET